ncbi:MAG TPA: hypothetical protein VFB19_18515 [Mycobacterium sp.]|nr:hypothetical protein [Mycobacterium sp.]
MSGEHGRCAEQIDGIGGKPLGCVLRHGHDGMHHDDATGADWAKREFVVGSGPWLERRRLLWNESARKLRDELRRYEDCHPDDSICLYAALQAARGVCGDSA